MKLPVKRSQMSVNGLLNQVMEGVVLVKLILVPQNQKYPNVCLSQPLMACPIKSVQKFKVNALNRVYLVYRPNQPAPVRVLRHTIGTLKSVWPVTLM